MKAAGQIKVTGPLVTPLWPMTSGPFALNPWQPRPTEADSGYAAQLAASHARPTATTPHRSLAISVFVPSQTPAAGEADHGSSGDDAAGEFFGLLGLITGISLFRSSDGIARVALEKIFAAIGSEAPLLHSTAPFRDGIARAREAFAAIWLDAGRDRSPPPPIGRGSIAILPAHRAGTVPSAATAAAATGIHLEMRQALEMRQSQAYELSTRVLSSAERYGRLYADAEKRRYQIPGTDLYFEVAIISRADAPEFIGLGSAGFMVSGLPFVIRDYFVDLAPARGEIFMRAIGSHEYVEALGAGHHMASLFELAVVQSQGLLEEYLAFLNSRYLVKFRDVSLYRLIDVAREELKDVPSIADGDTFVKPDTEGGDPAAAAALAMAEGFEITPDVRKRFAGIDREDIQALRRKGRAWVRARSALEQIQAFHQRALYDLQDAMRPAALGHAPNPAETRLSLRLAIFRALGCLSEEIEGKAIRADSLAREAKDILAADFIRELRRVISEDVPEAARLALEGDPLLDAGWPALAALAKADANIWLSIGIEPSLFVESSRTETEGPEAEIAADAETTEWNRLTAEFGQRVAEAMRQRAWRAAVEASGDLRAHGTKLRRIAAEMEQARGMIEALMANLESKMRPALGGGPYLDAADLAMVISEDMRTSLRSLFQQPHLTRGLPTALAQAVVDAVMPLIWEAKSSRSDFSGVPYETVADHLASDVGTMIAGLGDDAQGTHLRMKRLTSLHEAAAGDPERRGKIEEVAGGMIGGTDLKRNMDKIGSHLYLGSLEGTLAKRLIQISLERHRRETTDLFAPRSNGLLLLAAESADLDEFADTIRRVYAALAYSSASKLIRPRRSIALEALAESDALWEEFEVWLKPRIEDILRVVPRHEGPVAPISLLFAGQTPDSLWEKFGFRGAIEEAAASEDARPDDESLALLSLYDAMPYPETAMPGDPAADILSAISDGSGGLPGRSRDALVAEARRRVLEFIRRSLPDITLHPGHIGGFQIYVDLRAEALWRALDEKGRFTEGLPTFDVDLARLVDGWRAAAQEREGLGFGDFLAVAMSLEAHAARPDDRATAVPLLKGWTELRPIAEHVPFPEAATASQSLDALAAHEGFDLFGTMWRHDRLRLSATIAPHSLLLDETLREHFFQIIAHYSDQVDLSATETERDLRELARTMSGLHASCLLLISAIQRGKRLWGLQDAHAWLTGEGLEVDYGDFIRWFTDHGDPTLVWRMRTAFASDLDAADYRGYDQLGIMSREQRTSGRYRSWLPAHWAAASSRLAANPNRRRAHAELDRLIQDIPSLQDVGTQYLRPLITDWMTLAMLNGERFGSILAAVKQMGRLNPAFQRLATSNFVRAIADRRLMTLMDRLGNGHDLPPDSATMRRIGERPRVEPEYDRLGKISRQEREAAIRAPFGPNVDDLREHWTIVLERLVPEADKSWALGQIQRFLDDIEVLRHTHPTADMDDIVWRARRAWVLVAAANGRGFRDTRDVYRALSSEYPDILHLGQATFTRRMFSKAKRGFIEREVRQLVGLKEDYL